MLLFLAVIYFVIYAKFYCLFSSSGCFSTYISTFLLKELRKKGVVLSLPGKTLPIKCMHVLFGVAFCCLPVFNVFSFSNAFLVLADVWLIKANAPWPVETELPAITFPMG